VANPEVATGAREFTSFVAAMGFWAQFAVVRLASLEPIAHHGIADCECIVVADWFDGFFLCLRS
jgi:hypothetical protein